MKSNRPVDMNNLYDEFLQYIDKKNMIKDAPMGRYTSFKTGGCADLLVVVDSIEELKGVLRVLDEKMVPHILLGNGSNILVRDGGYRGVVVKLGETFNRIEVCGDRVKAYAGARISAVAKEAMEHSLAGFEFASGIPGGVGGGVFMNAGAYGGEVKDILCSVRAVSKDGASEYEMAMEDLALGYRHSIFQENGDIIVSADFQLLQGDKKQISAIMKALMDRRNEKQPVNLPSAGSFFKRPEGSFAGKLIQESGLSGLCVGGAQVSPLHAGFIVNNGEATAEDILRLMKLVQNTVFDKFGIKLEPEVRIIGEGFIG